MITLVEKFGDGLFRGPHPDYSTLAKAGIRTVVNLQADVYEQLLERSLAEHAGVRYFAIPACPLFPPEDDEVDFVRSLLADESLRPLYLHCLHGWDRTGYVVAAEQVVDGGKPFSDAVAEMRARGFHQWCFFWWVPFLERYCGSRRT